MQDSVSYSDLRENLKHYLHSVCAESQPLLVKQRNGEDVVIVSRHDFEAMEETNYLLRSPANARRLRSSLKEPAKKRIKYKSVNALREKFGI
jgi:antitoxin YefM